MVLTSHKQSLDYMKSLGFPVIPSYHVYTDMEAVIKDIEEIGDNRNGYAFDIDGAVVKVNDFSDGKKWEVLQNFRNGRLRLNIRLKKRKPP